MLFDLRSRGRRRTVQIIYGTLAVLMAGGLIFFGVGGSVGGGLFDAFNSDGSSSSSDIFAERAKTYQQRVEANPQDTKAWAELTRARVQDAASDSDQGTGVYNEDGRRKLAGAARAWARYLALKPAKPDDTVASLMVGAFGPLGLNRLGEATSAMEIVVDARTPSYGLYAQLAQLAYAAGQTRKGDLAAAKAISLAPKDQRPTVKNTLDEAKQAAASSTSSTTTASP